MDLKDLRPADGSTKRRKRIARGPGSGTGKMGGRGIKGQTSRSGVAINGFEGGQMPLHRRLPKRGFVNPFKKSYAVINLSTLQAAIDAGKLDPSQPIDEAKLLEAGVVRRLRDGVRLLGRGDLGVALTLTVTGASKAAVEAVEKAGGSVTLTAPQKTNEDRAESA